MTTPPVIVRIAGLPASSLESFSSSLALCHLETGQVLRMELADARSRLVDTIAAALPRFSPAARRVLLGAKRDAFNARSLQRYAGTQGWATLLDASGGLAALVLELEARIDEHDRAFAGIYDRELEEERRALFELTRDERFLRGIALSNPDVVSRLRELAEDAARAFGRRERKLEQSLVRYVTRAAAKLSPYSTLTKIALGTVHDEPERRYRFVSGEPREVSLVRVNRALLDRYLVVLLEHPFVRRACTVGLNDTREELEPGRYRFLRNSCWELDAERGEFRFAAASQVKVNLAPPLVEILQKALASGPIPYGELAAAVDAVVGSDRAGESDSHANATLDRLVSIGFLSLLPPWPTHEVYLERRLLEVLRTLPADPSLAEVVDALERLLALERGHVDAALPERSVAAIKEAISGVIAAVLRMAGDRMIPSPPPSLYEDVFLLPAHDEEGERELFRISATTVREIMTNAGLVSRFASLFNHRHDVLHTLAAFWRQRWPGRPEVSFLELFREAHALWKDYLRFDFTERYAEFSSFNPLRLASIDELNRLRAEIFAKTRELTQGAGREQRLPVEDLAVALDAAPARYGPLLGCHVFVQPAGDGPDLWVLNRFFEGTGRYLTRYGAVMDESMRRRFIAHFTARSALTVDGEESHLLDLLFTHGNMTNLRFPQTSRVLEMPGEHVAVPEERRVRLCDLVVRIDFEAETFRVLDREARRLIPVHMSSFNNLFMPVVLRFLSLFGPYETRQVVPRPVPECIAGVRAFSRLVCGNLVIRRQRWEVPLPAVDEDILKATGPEAFARVQRWRERLGIPQRVFLYEQMHQGSNTVQSYKPQYLDLGSPSLLSLFLSIVKKNKETLIFEEPLPSFTDFPLDHAGQRRAFELQIDELGLRGAPRRAHFQRPISFDFDVRTAEGPRKGA